MRKITDLNGQWEMGTAAPARENSCPEILMESARTVMVPNVWNLDDPTLTGERIYRRVLPDIAPDHSAFLEFEAVAGVCRVWINDILVGEHRGGYSRFRFEITNALTREKNFLTVSADNTRFPDVCPLGGDFNNYGGIYRNVRLIETHRVHFDLLTLGDTGLEISACVQEGVGLLRAKARAAGSCCADVCYSLLDESGTAAEACAPAGQSVTLRVPNVHLWDGLRDPHLYTCRARLLLDGQCIDEVELHCGFRTIELSPEDGFHLNGIQIKIHGVAKHQDREGAGSAATTEQLDEDMALIREIGANAVRLSHYQHPQYFYDLCDQNGLLVWAEIPMLSMPDGNDAVVANAKQQLLELIAQNRHHPSTFCWGIQNEVAIAGESLEMYRKVTELDATARKADPERQTACANLYYVKDNSPMNYITGIVGYNIYYGWYYGEMEDYGNFFDRFHAANPQVSLGVSEYGVDCKISLHAAVPKRKDYSEDFQTLFHETVYPQIAERDYLWGSFVWNMFDFGSAIRQDVGMAGQNRKGLVTFDRKLKKDAFYFYKACWSDEPFVYICGRRFAKRSGGATTVKVYSNQQEITLWVNGKNHAVKSGEKVFTFLNVPLPQGDTTLTASAGSVQDTIVLTGVGEPEQSYIYIDPNPEINVRNWFTPGQSEEDLFPPDRYSIMDTLGDLKASAQAWALLSEKVPQITDDRRLVTFPNMTLLRVLNRISGQFTDDDLKELNRELGTIVKEAKDKNFSLRCVGTEI